MKPLATFFDGTAGNIVFGVISVAMGYAWSINQFSHFDSNLVMQTFITMMVVLVALVVAILPLILTKALRKLYTIVHFVTVMAIGVAIGMLFSLMTIV